MLHSGNSGQNNELTAAQSAELEALYARYDKAPKGEREAIDRKVDRLLRCGTPSTDALERPGLLRVDHEDPVVREKVLKQGHKALKEGYAARQVVPRGGRDELMEARIAQHDPTCSSDQFVGGWGDKGLRKIAELTGYTFKQIKTKKIQEASAGFIYAIEGGRFRPPGSVSCVNSVFWATCPKSGELWGGDLRIETRTSRQGRALGWSAGTILHISGPRS